MSFQIVVKQSSQDPVPGIRNWIGRNTWVNPANFLLCCLAIIVLVSIYDTCLVYQYRAVIDLMEENPICLALIEMDPHNLSFFIGGKLAGNALVVTILVGLYLSGYRFRSLAAFAVAMFQLALLTYLHFADPSTATLCFDGLWSEVLSQQRRAIVSLIVHGYLVFGAGLVAATVFRSSKGSGRPGFLASLTRELTRAIR